MEAAKASGRREGKRVGIAGEKSYARAHTNKEPTDRERNKRARNEKTRGQKGDC